MKELSVMSTGLDTSSSQAITPMEPELIHTHPVATKTPEPLIKSRGRAYWKRLMGFAAIFTSGVIAILHPDCVAGEIGVEILKGAAGGAFIGVGLAILR